MLFYFFSLVVCVVCLMDGGTFYDFIMWFIFLTFFAYITRELEIWRIIKDVERYIILYKGMRDKALLTTLNAFKEVAARSKSKLDIKTLEDRVMSLVESVLIEPETMDPYGVVSKLKHIVVTGEETTTREVRRLIPSASEVEVENLKDLIAASRSMNMVYKAVDHIYRLGRKFKSIWLLYQLQALLPFLTEEMKSLESSLEAFTNGFPIGDSAGPLLAAKFIRKHATEIRIEEPAKETIAVEVPFKNRRIIVVKAKGPSGVTGRLDDALEELLVKRRLPAKLIITVDAALKFEGEKTGTIAQGVGVAIGGMGVEKFNIEKIATELGIPLYAILIKMSGTDALAIMCKEVYEAVDKALLIVERIIEEYSEEGDTIILIGVGNTVGIYP
ncbi:MAG: DUF1512 domain-containing protein [Thermoprotei archaeon]|nr:MAG: DUF1512 domain-containing protein [Thermoprotei archaeon]